jgi:hypothetical protein
LESKENKATEPESGSTPEVYPKKSQQNYRKKSRQQKERKKGTGRAKNQVEKLQN